MYLPAHSKVDASASVARGAAPGCPGLIRTASLVPHDPCSRSLLPRACLEPSKWCPLVSVLRAARVPEHSHQAMAHRPPAMCSHARSGRRLHLLRACRRGGVLGHRVLVL